MGHRQRTRRDHYTPCFYSKQWASAKGALCEFSRPHNAAPDELCLLVRGTVLMSARKIRPISKTRSLSWWIKNRGPPWSYCLVLVRALRLASKPEREWGKQGKVIAVLRRRYSTETTDLSDLKKALDQSVLCYGEFRSVPRRLCHQACSQLPHLLLRFDLYKL